MVIRQDASTGELVDDGKSAIQRSDEPSMQVKVHSPFKVYYDGEAYSVSAESATGPFDILPHHHNFITLLTPCALIVRDDKGETTINIAGGLMHVKADNVVVFLDV